MGYELIFKFCEKKEDGSYNREDVKTFKKVIGKATEDTPLEDAAKVVFGQLARRDIWVLDVEPYEYTKKKVSFKETKEGILLKNKKFSFDLTCEDINFEGQEVATTEQTQSISSTAQVKQQPALAAPQRPVRYEVFDPHPDIAATAKKLNLPFSVGKRYPVYEEKPDPRGVLFGMTYLTQDDQGNRRTLNDKYFVPVVNMLENDMEPHSAPQRSSLNQGMLTNSDSYVAPDGRQVSLPQIHTFRR